MATIIEVDLTIPNLSAKTPPKRGPIAAIAKEIEAMVLPDTLLKMSLELAAKLEFKNTGLHTRIEYRTRA